MIAVMMTGIVYADDTEIIASGICGFEGKDNLTWELDSKGNLFITGSGDMNNYSLDSPAENPWNDFRSQIKTINISEGAINLGWYAFADFSNLTFIFIF